MIPEAAIALLACARIGAIHSVVFGGFSPGRARGPDHRLRSDTSWSPPTKAGAAGKTVPLKANVDAALAHCSSVETVIVVAATGGACGDDRRPRSSGIMTRRAAVDRRMRARSR